VTDKLPLYLLGGVALLVYLRREKEQAPVFEINPVPGGPVEDTDSLPDPKFPTPSKTPTSGISLGWAPSLPVRPAFVAENWEDSSPCPGKFYQVRRRDQIESIASRALRALAQEAAELSQMESDAAATWVDNVSRSASLVRQAVDSISTGWNDEVYGSSRVPLTAPHGRGVDLEPVHDEVRTQLVGGRTPRRNLSATGFPTKAGAKCRPYLWIPRWDAVAFLSALDAGRDAAVLSERDPYQSGITGHWPLPAVTERGVLHG